MRLTTPTLSLAALAFVAAAHAAAPVVAPTPSFPSYGQDLKVEAQLRSGPRTFPPRATRSTAT